jgi:hypothetical protein
VADPWGPRGQCDARELSEGDGVADRGPGLSPRCGGGNGLRGGKH